MAHGISGTQRFSYQASTTACYWRFNKDRLFTYRLSDDFTQNLLLQLAVPLSMSVTFFVSDRQTAC
jgi:hypothetical protein